MHKLSIGVDLYNSSLHEIYSLYIISQPCPQETVTHRPGSQLMLPFCYPLLKSMKTTHKQQLILYL